MTELPPGWAMSSIGELTDTSLGKMLDAKQATGHHPTPYLRNVNVRWGTFDRSDVATMDIRPVELERVLARAGDVIVCEGGEPGRAAVWRRAEPIALQKALHRVRTGPCVCPDFLALLLRHQAESGELSRLFTGTTIKHLPQEKLRMVRVPVPPIHEQERIVEAIEEAFSKLDAGEVALRTARQRLKRMRDAVLTAAVTGRLVPQDPTDTRVETRAEPATEAASLRLPGVPIGWSWRPIEALAANERNALAIGPFGSNLKVADYRDAGVPLVFVRNIRRRDFDVPARFVSESKAAELAAHVVRPGDVLVTKMGDPPGDAAVYRHRTPAVITADCVKVTPSDAVLADYLTIAVTAGETRRQLRELTSGVAQQKITLAGFRRLAVPVPPLAEQNRIVSEVDRQFSFIEVCESAVDAGLTRSAALRRSVLKAAFEGRLVPQDPSDEPASVLVERIREERSGTGSPRLRSTRTVRSGS